MRQGLLSPLRQRTLEGRDEALFEAVAAVGQEGPQERDCATLELFAPRGLPQLALVFPRGPEDHLKAFAGHVRAAHRQRVKAAKSEPGKRPLSLNKGESKIRNCGGGLAPAWCEGGHLEMWSYSECSRSCVCEACRRHVQNERARPVEVLFEAMDHAGPPAHFWAVFPPKDQVRPILRDQGVTREVRLALWHLLQMARLANEGIDESGWAMGAKAVDHPCGDDEKTFKPHFNFGGPLVALKARRVARKRPNGSTRKALVVEHRKTLSWTMKPQYIEWLERGWRWLQEVLLGKSLGSKSVVDVEFVRPDDVRRKRHHIRYFNRGFPPWPASAQRVRGLGYLGNSVLRDVPEVKAALERDKKRKEEEDENDRHPKCATCGKPVTVDQSKVPIHWKRSDGDPLVERIDHGPDG